MDMTKEQQAIMTLLQRDVEVAKSYLDSFNPKWADGMDDMSWTLSPTVLPTGDPTVNIVSIRRVAWGVTSSVNPSKGLTPLELILVHVKDHEEVVKVDVH